VCGAQTQTSRGGAARVARPPCPAVQAGLDVVGCPMFGVRAYVAPLQGCAVRSCWRRQRDKAVAGVPDIKRCTSAQLLAGQQPICSCTARSAYTYARTHKCRHASRHMKRACQFSCIRAGKERALRASFPRPGIRENRACCGAAVPPLALS